MRAHPRGTLLLTLLALLALGGAGCAILAPGEGHGGGSSSLSDAVREASRDSSDKTRTLHAGVSTPPASVEVVGVQADALSGAGEPGAEGVAVVRQASRPERHRPLFGLCISEGVLGGTDYDGFGSLSLTGGDFVTGPWRWDLIASAGYVGFKGESKLGVALTDAMDLQLDLTGRWYATPQHTFVGVYAIAGLATGTLFWDYAKRIPVVQDGRPTDVGDDHINHFDGYVGVGTTVMQLRHVHVGVNGVAGVRFYGWHTFNGFDNDMLPTTGFVRGLMELEFR